MSCSRMVESLEVRRCFAVALPAGFSETAVVTGLNGPIATVPLPDGRLLVAQKDGAVRVIKGGQLLPTPATQLTVDTTGERGLVGMAVDPNFAANHYLYLHYFVKGGIAKVSRFTLNGDVVAAGSELQLIKIDAQRVDNASHAGGGIAFGGDGKLYIAVGDNETPPDAQSLDSMHGKLLRISSNGSIPTDNPYYATLTGARRAIFATGLRNPFTIAADPASGKVFINDVGEKAFEEIDLARRGANFGWPNTEGPTDDPAYDGPVYSYAPAEVGDGACVIGGAFYNKTTQQFPAQFAGQYFFGDFTHGFLRTLDPATGTASDFATGFGQVIDFDVAADGTLYVTTRDGVLHAVRYGEQPPPPPPPGTASFSGYVINDVNGNGKWDSGEKGITGRTVWIDLDNDSMLDADEPTQTTAAGGRFTFSNLAAGTYKFREVVPAGSKQTSPANNFGLAVTLAAGQTKSGMSFQIKTA